MEKNASKCTVEKISQVDKLRPEMAFVAIVDRASRAEPIGEFTWRSRGNCTAANAEGFYPQVGENNKEAKKLCDGCDVRQMCLDYAIAMDEQYGVWGGKTKSERIKYKAQLEAGTIDAA